jgi:hypothetical protein
MLPLPDQISNAIRALLAEIAASTELLLTISVVKG